MQTKIAKWVIIVSVSLSLILASAGYAMNRYAIAKKPKIEIVEKVITIVDESAPVLDKIAKCESNNQQFYMNGKLVRGKENPYDVGVFQINELYHWDTAHKMGLDIMTEQGNRAFALHLYKTQGTRPWKSSESCWAK